MKVESSPDPTCSSKHEPAESIEDIISPSSTIVHESPSIKASTPSSNACIVASVGVSVGIRTRRIVGSAYAPSTFCIDHVWVESLIENIPAHSNGPAP